MIWILVIVIYGLLLWNLWLVDDLKRSNEIIDKMFTKNKQLSERLRISEEDGEQAERRHK